MTTGKISQDVVEVAEGGPNAAKISQEAVEVVGNPTPPSRISQDVVEVVGKPTPPARISQDVLETLQAGNRAKVSQVVVEMLILTWRVFVPVVYPDLPGLGYSVHWSPKAWNMETWKGDTGSQIDLSYSDTVTHNFELTYDFLRGPLWGQGSLEFRTFMGFFMLMQGNFGRFLFRNPDDYSVTNQLVATADGINHIFPIVRTFGVGEYKSTEPVGYVDKVAPLNVYYDGVLQPKSSYVIDTTTPVAQTIDTTSTLTAGVKITMDFDFYYYCKLENDTLDFEKFMRDLWLVKSVKINSLRAGD